MTEYAYRRLGWADSSEHLKFVAPGDREAIEWARKLEDLLPGTPIHVFKREKPAHDWKLIAVVE